jgi:EpsI family protein
LGLRKKEYWIALGLLLLAGVYGFTVRYQHVEVAETIDLQGIPMSIGEWQGEDFFFTAEVLDVLKADETFNRRYMNRSGEEVWLFIGYWKDQKYGAQPHSPLHCLPGSGWNIIRNERTPVATGSNGHAATPDFEANFAVIQNQEYQQQMLYWYQTRSGTLPKELQVKFDLARNALLRRPTDAAFIRLIRPVRAEENDQGRLLHAFWNEAARYVQRELPFGHFSMNNEQ